MGLIEMEPEVLHGDNLPHLKTMSNGTVPLIYIDPPFNTGRTQKRARLSYKDSFDDFIGFLRPRLIEAHRILTSNGSLFFHIDWRESARCRLLLEEVFGGPKHCINEIIWVYDFGGKSRDRWSPKHDTIYWFAKSPSKYIFNYDAVDRIPYMAPGLAGSVKAERGKTPTDTWWNTIAHADVNERTDYPTQKPLAILDRIIRVHSNPGDIVMDFFAGSGTTGVAALNNGRRCVLIDESPDAIRVIRERLSACRTQPLVL